MSKFSKFPKMFHQGMQITEVREKIPKILTKNQVRNLLTNHVKITQEFRLKILTKNHAWKIPKICP